MSNADRNSLSGKGTLAGSFFAALQFLTVIPPVIRRPFTFPELGRSLASYPLVGLMLGAVLAGFSAITESLLPDSVRAVLVLGLWVSISGALHIDGLMDSLDGLFGGQTPERRLDIMRDERVGAYGAAGGILLLLLKTAAVMELTNPPPALLLAPVLGRWAVTLTLYFFPYARQMGLGSAIKTHASGVHVAFATLAAAAISSAIAGWDGLILMIPALAAALLVAQWTLRHIPGLTGDIYGAVCELVETTVLIIGLLVLR